MDTCAKGHNLLETRRGSSSNTYCLECRKEFNSKWNKENGKKASYYSWKSRIKRKYGIDENDYEELYYSQNGKCAICSCDLKIRDKQTHIDHSHSTGEVRGLLCHYCNIGIGVFKEDREIIMNALNYLGLEK